MSDAQQGANVHVKICGITRLEDALVAAGLGASAVGFIFWPGSPRFIDPYRARPIACALPPMVVAVGVFVDQPAWYVRGVASLVRVGAVQLHGAETPGDCAGLRHRVIKVLTPDPDGTVPQADCYPPEVTLLLDACDPERRGGTGRTIDWAAAETVARRRRVILAGGLRPENVAAAVATVRPYGIDVSSGVERRAGVKDHARLRELFEAVGTVGARPGNRQGVS